MNKKTFCYISLILILSLVIGIVPMVSAEQGVIKVACVGDSITQGVGVENAAAESYPAQLQALLGSGYSVGNFGVSKYAVLKSALFPYWKTDAYTKSLESESDIVVIMLGTNDIKTENWVNGKANFTNDYVDLINSYKTANPNAQIYVTLPPPIYLDVTDQVRPPLNLQNEAIPLMKTVAQTTGSTVIDVFGALQNNANLFTDKLHPNKEGAGLIAKAIYDKIKDSTTTTTTIPTTAKYNIACVGDSITAGYGLANAATESYPAQLQTILRSNYYVENFGVSGCSIANNLSSAYTKTDMHKKSLEFKSNYVFIMLGTNDIQADCWGTAQNNFVQDYTSLIKSYSSIESAPKVYLMLPPPVYRDDNKRPVEYYNSAIEMIKNVASATGAGIIDVKSALTDKASLFPDKLHPNAEGAGIIASLVKNAIQPSWLNNINTLNKFDNMDDNITREEFAYLLVNGFNLQDNNAVTSFTDISNSKYSKEIASAYAKGIISGIDNTHFDPTGDITRQEITVMLYRMWKVLFSNSNFEVNNTYNFVDNDQISDWAKDAIVYLYDKQIMNGTDTLTISPLLNIPRKDALTLITRIAEKYQSANK